MMINQKVNENFNSEKYQRRNGNNTINIVYKENKKN